jgi:hypothetical protein
MGSTGQRPMRLWDLRTTACAYADSGAPTLNTLAVRFSTPIFLSTSASKSGKITIVCLRLYNTGLHWDKSIFHRVKNFAAVARKNLFKFNRLKT